MDCSLTPVLPACHPHRLGLDVPLFNRLLEAGITSKLLDVQYRMHPAISAWPSAFFYQGGLPSPN